MASTKEDQHQASVKHAPPKHDPAIPPPRPARSRTTEPLRHPVEGRTVAPAPTQVVDPMAVSGPLRLLMVIIGLASLGALGSAWYRTTHQVVDDGHLVLQGNIDVRQVNLAFKVDGRIATLEVDEGDLVKAGQTVATLDHSYFEDDLRAVKARRDSAQATLEKLEHGSRPQEIATAKAQVTELEASSERAYQDFKRFEELVAKGGVSKKEFDAYTSVMREAQARLTGARQSLEMVEIGPRQEEIAVARAQLAAEQASVIQSERRLADSILVAPSDGIVLTRARERGPSSRRRNHLLVDADLASVGADLRQRTRPGANRTGNEGRSPHRFGTRQDLRRTDRLHFSRPPNSHPRPSKRASCGPTWSIACASSSTTPTAGCARECRSP